MFSELRKKSVQSYVVRPGRITPSQKRALGNETFDYGLFLKNGLINLEKTFNNTHKTILEIGFGMGSSVAEMASNNPNENYIGIEVHAPGIGNLINLIHDLKLSNIRIYWADAIDVIDECIPDKSIDRFQVFFPDPWHKKKHNKRRLVTENFLAKVSNKLKSGGIFHFVSDWKPYADSVIEISENNDLFVNTALNGKFTDKPDYRPMTKFEKRGIQLGHSIWEIILQKIEEVDINE